MVKRALLLIASQLCFAALAHAAGPDFYGVKMKSEDFAEDLMVRENNIIPDFSNDRPGMDRRVYAYAYASSWIGRGRGLSIKVHNHSEDTIPTERLFRECAIVTKDGRRYDRSETEMQWRRDKLKPGQIATFNIIFKGVDLRLEDVRMIILSFDLGKINIFLFPTRAFGEPTLPPKRLEPQEAQRFEADAKTLPEVSGPSPALAEAAHMSPKPGKAAASKPADSAAKEPAKADAPKGPHCVTPVTMVQSIFSGVGSAVGSIGQLRAPRLPWFAEKRTPVPPPAAPGVEAARYHFSPEFKAKVQEGEKKVQETVFVDRPWSMENPEQADVRVPEDYPLPQSAPPRIMAEVVQVDARHGFIVFNAGKSDGVKQESVVSVLRNGRRIGKAMVRKVRDKVSAAGILPEWQTKSEIKAGDRVELS